MKYMIRILITALAIMMVVSGYAIPASATCPVDDLAPYGQQTWSVYPVTDGKAPNVTDGIVSEGEYGEALATVVPGDHGSTISNWTEEGDKHLEESDLLEIAPERMTLYATFDEDYLYMALVVVKVRHYSQAPRLNEIWGTENWLLSLYFDAYADERGEGKPWAYSDALSERFCICSGLTSIGGAPAEPLSLIGEQCSYMMYAPWDPVEDFGSTRNDDTQTTTYEFKAAWENIIWNYESAKNLPDRVPIITQYVLADDRYLENVTEGYVNCVGSFRWATEVTAAVAEEAGIQVTDPNRVKFIPHLLQFVWNDDPDETTAVTDQITDGETDAVTDPVTNEVTDGETAEVTSLVTEALTPAATDSNPAEGKGCGSALSLGFGVLISAAAVIVALKKKS